MDPQIESLNTVVSDAALQYQFGSKLDLQFPTVRPTDAKIRLTSYNTGWYLRIKCTYVLNSSALILPGVVGAGAPSGPRPPPAASHSG